MPPCLRLLALLILAALSTACPRTTSLGAVDGGLGRTTLTVLGNVCTAPGHVLRALLVQPASAARLHQGFSADGDGDGLADEVEPSADAAAATDFDGDGFDDLFETRRGSQAFDPALKDARGCDATLGCTLEDPDGDGLSQVAEAVLGSSAQRVDSDADGLPDGLEVRAELDPAAANGGDGDGDTVLDTSEVQLGTDPRVADEPLASPRRFRVSWTLASEDNGTRCYDLTLENLPMQAPEGQASIFKLWLSEGLPAGPRDDDTWSVACAQALLDQGQRLPPDLELGGLSNAHFKPPPQLVSPRATPGACLVPEGWTR